MEIQDDATVNTISYFIYLLTYLAIFFFAMLLLIQLTSTGLF